MCGKRGLFLLRRYPPTTQKSVTIWVSNTTKRRADVNLHGVLASNNQNNYNIMQGKNEKQGGERVKFLGSTHSTYIKQMTTNA